MLVLRVNSFLLEMRMGLCALLDGNMDGICLVVLIGTVLYRQKFVTEKWTILKCYLLGLR